MEKEIANFSKNSTEQIKVMLKEYKGHQLIDFRVYFANPGESKFYPTRKGLTIKTDLIPQLKKALEEAETILNNSQKGK